MPAWVWLFWVFCIAEFAFLLWRAWTKQYVKYGPLIYSLEETPVYFWFFVVTFIGAELFALAVFILAVVSSIWGPIVHQ